MLYEPSAQERDAYADFDICILTPHADYECAAMWSKDVVNMTAYSWRHGLQVSQQGVTQRMVVDWARNDLARQARTAKNEYTGKQFTHLLWLDDDHRFNPDMALWLAAHIGERDMLSAIYFGRSKPLPVVYVRTQGMPKDDLKHYPLVEFPEGLFSCDAVGFGALLMRRDVFDRVPEPWFTIDWRGGEDIAFCHKAKEHGIGVYADGRYVLGHIGEPVEITSATYRAYLAEHPELQDKVRVDL